MSSDLHLFGGYGVELEYMIVDQESLDIRPVADRILFSSQDGYANEIERDAFNWSNELALHVIELKTGAPAKELEPLVDGFASEVRCVNERLRPHRCLLLPGAMHPWMNPHTETKLWPHGDRSIYQAFDRIFGCRGHGWSNLQSVHLNLPFGSDEEFVRLHAALRIILPLLPALAASSPYLEGKSTPFLDNRLEAYRSNCSRIPSLTGLVVPEPVTGRAHYQEIILDRIYRDLTPHDPDGVIRYEWSNARGVIARFDRNTLEVRLLDVQECPLADLSVLAFLVEILRALLDERWAPLDRVHPPDTVRLHQCLLEVIRCGRQAALEPDLIPQAFGMTDPSVHTAGELLCELAKRLPEGFWTKPITTVLQQGALSERLRRFAGLHPDRAKLKSCYSQLADCLAENRLFLS